MAEEEIKSAQTNGETQPVGENAEPAKSVDTASGNENVPEAEKAGKDTSGKTMSQEAQRINSENARRRREEERKNELKKARLDAIREVVSKNEFTGEAIEDEDDVEEYLMMKKIDEEGGDPLFDFAKYQKKFRKEKAEKAEKEQKEESITDTDSELKERIKSDASEFISKYPKVSMNELFEDASFIAFAEGKLGNKPLSEIYEGFVNFKKDAEKQAAKIATERAAVGSLAGSGSSAEPDFFTKEQVMKMSPAEIHKNYEKIRKSQEKW